MRTHRREKKEMKYAVTLYMSRYMQVDGEWQNVDVKRTFTFNSWDDVQNFIGYLVEGAGGSVKFEAEAVANKEA